MEKSACAVNAYIFHMISEQVVLFLSCTGCLHCLPPPPPPPLKHDILSQHRQVFHRLSLPSLNARTCTNNFPPRWRLSEKNIPQTKSGGALKDLKCVCAWKTGRRRRCLTLDIITCNAAGQEALSHTHTVNQKDFFLCMNTDTNRCRCDFVPIGNTIWSPSKLFVSCQGFGPIMIKKPPHTHTHTYSCKVRPGGLHQDLGIASGETLSSAGCWHCTRT